MLEPEAYLAGVLKGDGWCTDYIGLRVADQDFAEVFAHAILLVFSIPVKVRKDERGYWLVRTSNLTGKFTYLITYEPLSLDAKAAWLRGMFDSEGNAQLHKLKRGDNCYVRRVAMYSTHLLTLNTASRYLSDLSILHSIRTTKNSPGHIGSKTVYELRIQSRKSCFERFRTLIGSNIERKQATLDAIVASYVPDLSLSRKKSQLKGAQVKHRKTMEVTLPLVVEGIREIIRRGETPKYRQCRETLQGFSTIEQYYTFRQMVDMAKADIDA